MKYSRQEQETTIVWDEEQKLARIYTASPAVMRKLDKLAEECPHAYSRVWVDKFGSAAKYEASARFIRFGKPASASQIEAGRRNAARMRLFSKNTN